MKARALGELIQLAQDLTGEQREATRLLASHFVAAPATATAAATVKKLLSAAGTLSPEPNAKFLMRELEPALHIVAQITRLMATPAVATACQNLASLCTTHPDVSVPQLTSPPARALQDNRAPAEPNLEVVQKHLSALLTKAPGTAGFGEALDNLKADKGARVAEMRLIAEKLGVKVAGSAARAGAFNKISNEHKIIIDAAAKSAALRGGGSA